MIPKALQSELLDQITPNKQNTLQDKTDISDSKQKPIGYLCALIDMAALTDSIRDEINEKFAQRLYPLIVEPSLHELTPLSAHLLALEQNDLNDRQSLFDDLSPYNSDVISAWIASVLPTQQLAQHFQQATFAYDEKQRKYLLRYYDPFVTPVLYDETPVDWQRWFFAPIYSWWFAKASPEREQWHKLVGHAKPNMKQSDMQGNPLSAPKLVISETLWQTLSSDPLAHYLLDELEKQGTAIFADECRGIRLAQVEQAIGQAHQQGFSEHRHVCEYVWLAFHYAMNKIVIHSDWLEIKEQVLQGQKQLLTEVHAFITAYDTALFKLH